MRTGQDAQEIRAIAASAGRGDMVFKVIITLAAGLAMFELNRVSAAVERVEARQLAMAPELSALGERMSLFHDACCSELGRVKGDVIFEDDAAKAAPRGR